MRSTLLAMLMALSGVAHAANDGVVLSEFVFARASFPQCHASTIVEAKNGLVAAWFGGTHEKHEDVGIWVSLKQGGQWITPFEVANGVQYVKPDGTVHRHPCWNPVLVRGTESDGEHILLFYKCGPNPQQWWGMLAESRDGGSTWSRPVRLPDAIDGPVKNKPIRLPGGDLLCGSSTEYDGWRVHFERTSDDGRTWMRIGPINDGTDIGAIQPSILRHNDGRLQALGRSRQSRIWQSWSTDNGVTWGPMTLTDLPNPNAGTDAVTLNGGRQVLVYNNTIRESDFPKGREMLNVAFSDDGESWNAALILDKEAAAEFSYPAIIQTADGLVHITYTWKRQRIKHTVIDPAQVVLQPITNGVWPD